MARGKRYQPEQVVNLLRQIEVAVANGKTTAQACKEVDRQSTFGLVCGILGVEGVQPGTDQATNDGGTVLLAKGILQTDVAEGSNRQRPDHHSTGLHR